MSFLRDEIPHTQGGRRVGHSQSGGADWIFRRE